MPPFVIRPFLQTRLTDEVFDVLLDKVTTTHIEPVLVDLAGNNLQFYHLLNLTKHFENTNTRVFALDMAQNHVEADWESLNQVVDRLLGQDLVWYMDLGMNYLPPTCSLEQSPAVRQNFLKYGQRLSLGLDCNHYTGEAEVDMWTRNARVFKKEDYGVRHFADDDPEEFEKVARSAKVSCGVDYS